MSINWSVRLKNPTFWATAVPTILLGVQMIARAFGYDIAEQVDVLSDELVSFINSIVVTMALLGITIDPTTEGVSDSENALGYEELG